MTSVGIMGARNLARCLPYDAEVEYLESTGTQYIMTSIYPTSDYTFDATVGITLPSSNVFFFGVRSSGNYASNNQQCYLAALMAGQGVERHIRLISLANSSSSNWDSAIEPVVGNMYTVTGAEPATTMNDMTRPMTIFGFNNLGTPNTANGVCRIGSVIVYADGNKLAHFQAVRFTNEQGVSEGAMFDRANPTVGMGRNGETRTDGLYLNRGTGSFLCGNDI